MAISNGFWPLNLSVESLVLREIVPIITTCHLGPSAIQYLYGTGTISTQCPAPGAVLPCGVWRVAWGMDTQWHPASRI
jgi:hypothetical protein